jgi:NitT/TauT family transport system ATP-binding protein
MEPKKSKITVRNVSRCFLSPEGKRIDAVQGINFNVEDAYSREGRDIGEFRVLLGPSGCGKSTLLRMIAGLDRPDTGEVLVNDQPVHGPGRDRGMVFQKYTSFPWLTVAGNIAYGLKINGVAEEKRKETVAQLIDAVGLKGFENSYPETLSGDETASTILFVTHDVEEAIYLADRIFIMSSHPGTIVEDVQVPFERPRDLGLKERNEFHELQSYVLGRLRRAPGAGGNVRVSV